MTARHLYLVPAPAARAAADILDDLLHEYEAGDEYEAVAA